MIIEKIIDVIFEGLIILFSFFSVHLATIPMIGDEIVSILTTAVQAWNTLMEMIPYLHTTWTIFLWVIMPFEITMLTLKFFLGHRMPTNA